MNWWFFMVWRSHTLVRILDSVETTGVRTLKVRQLYEVEYISQIAERYRLLRDNSNDFDDVSTLVILLGFHIQKNIQKRFASFCE